MSKPAIARLFVGSIVALIAGIMLIVVALIAAFSGGAFTMDGSDVTGINSSGFTWTMIGLIIVGALAIVGGAIGSLVSWIGALLNTVQLEDKVWFVLLLVLGLFSFGFIAMVAYLIAGPDAYRRDGVTFSVNLGSHA